MVDRGKKCIEETWTEMSAERYIYLGFRLKRPAQTKFSPLRLSSQHALEFRNPVPLHNNSLPKAEKFYLLPV